MIIKMSPHDYASNLMQMKIRKENKAYFSALRDSIMKIHKREWYMKNDKKNSQMFMLEYTNTWITIKFFIRDVLEKNYVNNLDEAKDFMLLLNTN